ncbi:MAG: T9SS type A sorting domain-containing protein [Candidatus Cloacimonetes bacterium]|nr:T9SS type A sorting domain-containing protein [Candidatus Cloacimonadota bacterium]
MKRILFILSLISIVSSLLCIEVGGHITQNTTWTPDNNPYIITLFLYVDAGVTLTIMPGTQVLCSGADKSNINNFMWSGNNQPLAKMVIVNGAINAVGTADNPITFDKYQAGANYRWGGIYMAHNAPTSNFEFCEFRNTFFCDYIPGEWSLAAIVFENGVINVRNSTFENNLNAIGSGSLQSDLLLYKCRFISTNDSYPPPFGLTGFFGIGASSEPVPEENYIVTIAKCYFTGNAVFGTFGNFTNSLLLNNVFYDFTNRGERSAETHTEYGSSSCYGNFTYNGSGGWSCYSATISDTVYSRRNKLIKPENANPGNSPLIIGSDGFGTNYVSDNYLSGCVQVNTTMSNATTSYIYNNVIENNYADFTLLFENLNPAYQGGQIRFFNNLVTFWGDYQYPKIVYTYETSPFIFNNTFIDYRTLFRTIGESDMVFENNIIPCTQWSSGSVSQNHHPLLINNCLASNILPPWDMLDGGGNIVADPVFADTLNGDYSLSIDSPCIDTGAYRPDLPEFDIRYHKRIASGTDGGQQTIDIGAYEFNSAYIGGLSGIVFNPDNGEMIDCAKIEINQKLPEFSDSLGCFEYPTGPGVYTVRASRWDYKDQIIENIVVNEGEIVQVAIPMYLTTTAIDDPVTPSLKLTTLTNYPNPFNPETTISFIAPQAGTTKLSVFNIKGQRVNMLYNGLLSKGHHSIVWNGLDERGTAVSSGIYFVRVEMNGISQTHKMILMK